jgi:hypothetical protein
MPDKRCTIDSVGFPPQIRSLGLVYFDAVARTVSARPLTAAKTGFGLVYFDAIARTVSARTLTAAKTGLVKRGFDCPAQRRRGAEEE